MATPSGPNLSVQLSWKPVPGAKGYNVWRYVRSQQEYLLTNPAPNPTTTGTTFTDVANNSIAGSTVQITNVGTPFAGYRFGPQGTTTPLLVTPQIQLAPVPFASLGTSPNGSLVYCADCKVTNPCAGGGTGAIAKRLDGVWVCN
jgi:hypothetical protein